MYAVMETGGKQLRVSPGDKVRISKLDVAVGESVVVQKVLMITSEGQESHIGTPYVEGAAIDGRVLRHDKEKKINVLKYKPKKRYRVRTGHRQDYTLIEIDTIRIGEEILGNKEGKRSDKPSVEEKNEIGESGETPKITGE